MVVKKTLNKKKLDVLAVIFDIGLTVDNSSVFQSQVVDQLVALSKMEYKVGLFCVYSDFQSFSEGVGAQLQNHGVELFCEPDRGFVKNFFTMIIRLRSLRSDVNISNGYVRGLWGGLVIILSKITKPLPYVYDVRGDLLDEVKATGAQPLKSSIYIFLEQIALARAKHVSVVSRPLKEIIAKRMLTHKPISIVPSCVNSFMFSASENEILQKREQLGISTDDIVLLYSGGLSHYQKIPEMLQLWTRIHDDCSNIKFILFTNSDPHSLPSEIGNLDHFGDNLQIYNLPRGQLISMLHVADIAFLLRDDRILNKVASPVKFAEYISSGLAVVGSPNTGDISSHIVERNIGMLVSPSDLFARYDQLLEFITSFNKHKKGYSLRSKQLANNTYEWQSYRENFIEMYGMPNSSCGKL